MRWGSLFSTLLLAGASASLPRLLSSTGGLNAQGLAGMVKELSAANAGQASDADFTRVLQALANGQPDSLPLEKLAVIQGLAQKQDLAAGLLEAFKNQQPLSREWSAQVLRASEEVRRIYRGLRERIMATFILAGLGVLAVAILGALPPFRGMARLLLGMTFGLSGRWLIFVSLASAAYFMASRLNPWPLLPPEILAAPVGFMLLSGLFLRLLDPNYPLWNTMLCSFAAPIAACLGISGYIKLVVSA